MYRNRMKGIDLPINVIVIVAVAVLVLIVVAAFFANSLGGGQITIERQKALDSACQNLRSLYNCDANAMSKVSVKYSEIGESTPQTHYLPEICTKLNLDTSPSNNQCLIRCGCSTAGAGGTQATPLDSQGNVILPGTATPK